MEKDKKWKILAKSRVKSGELKEDNIVDILLGNRGIKTEKDKKEFFSPTEPPKLSLRKLGMNQAEMNKAITRIKMALKTREKVIIYGDYDADGICGTALIWETLYALGLNVVPYIPERFSEGYGLNTESIRRLKEKDPNLNLIITVDHGIVANKKIDFAKELGIDVVISDHHTPGKTKPKAYAVVHTTKIGGAAVAWILAREIRKRIRNKKLGITDGLELVAIGTIADQLSLIGANRAFVKYGLISLNKTRRPGFLALFEKAGISQVGPYEVGFMIAPRLNAAGRLEHAMQSLRLICTKDPSRARILAGDLNRVNLERQKIVGEVVTHARASMSEAKLDKIIVLAHESYHEGVIGLAASKLVEEFYRPAIVFAKKKKIAKASARSIVGFDVIAAIRKLNDLLIEGGGHPMAAGFSIAVGKVDEFAKRLREVSDRLLPSEILTKKIVIDLPLEFRNLTPLLFKKIVQFEPLGLGNPTPTFATKDVTLVSARTVGHEGTHLKMNVEKNGFIFEAIAFGLGALLPSLKPGIKVDLVYSLEENTWSGERKLELKVKDIKW